MAGFVCMDPRLNKAVYEKEAFNRMMTKEALSGAIHKTGGTEGQDLAALTAEWKANFHPLVISRQRIDQLLALRAIDAAHPEPAGVEIRKEIGTPGFHGTSSKGGLTITWHLVRLRPGLFEGVTGDQYGIFVEASAAFTPEYFGGAKPIITAMKLGHMRHAPCHALYGLTNPIPRGRNTRFKDCVTGDYDLFGVWPFRAREGMAPLARPSARELQMAVARKETGGIGNSKISNFPDKNWDTRPQDQYLKQDEHYQLGNISRRVNLIKVMLNTMLQADGSEAVGAKSQLVHHSDEVGNPDALLAKPLIDCLPIIGFIPGEQEAFTMETMLDLRTFIDLTRDGGFSPHLKPDWRADVS
jgi:hypothetical protein